MEDTDTCLFIGGVSDGMYYNIPNTVRRWCIPVLQTVRQEWITNPETIPQEVPYIEVYYRFKLATENKAKPNHLFIFVHESIYNPDAAIYPKEHTYDANWKIMCALVNNYKVIK